MRDRVRILTLFALGMALAGCGRPGQRLLHARIEQGGKPVLESRFGVSDRWDGKDAWRELDGVSFTVVAGATLPAASGNTITLKGKSRVALDHVKTPFAAADVDDLVLESDPAKPGEWKIPKSEVERSLKEVR